MLTARHTVMRTAGAASLLLATCLPAQAASASGWQVGQPLLTPRGSFSLTTLADGRLLAAGGQSGAITSTACEIYSPATRSWTATGSLNVARERHAAVRLADGRVLVAGGTNSVGDVRSAEIFDPATGTWTRTPDMAFGGRSTKAVLLKDGRVFAHVGQAAAEIYDPAQNKWTLTVAFLPWRDQASVTLLNDGRVLVAAGMGLGGPVATGIVYTPSTNTWQETGPFLFPRDSPSTTLLADGKVLMVGGWSWHAIPGGMSSGATIAEAELFDPATLTWSAAGQLTDSRVEHSATRLWDGTVVVAGGLPYDDNGPLPALKSVEVYDPKTNAFAAGPAMTTAQVRPKGALLPRGELIEVANAGTEILGPALWHSWFAVDALETPYVGDFDGNGKDDIITFTRQNPSAVGDVYVALSAGTKFGDNTKWHDWFAITTDETVVIGDYDGDGKDDIATWLGTTTRQAYVARSLGTGMTPETVWADSIGFDPTDVILSGDANGDGKDDLICFARRQGKVYVATSTGSSFTAPAVWHSWFAVSTYERPRVADVNGDGKADIVTFATDSPTAKGDVYVAVSDGTKFGDNAKWHDWFAVQPGEQIRIGDQNADGKDDFFTFMPAPMAQCYTVRSLSTSMDDNALWPEPVAPQAKDVPYVGDANGDGKADIIVFAQGEGKVYVSFGR